MGRPANEVISSQLSEVLNLRLNTIQEGKKNLLSRFGVMEDFRYYE